MAHGGRQVGAAGVFGGDGMFELVGLHLLKNGAGAQVAFRYLIEMGFQVFDHLIFRFRHKAQAPAVADQAGGGTHCIAHGVEQRIKFAGHAAQFLNALLTPGQMVFLFPGGLFHGVANMRQAGGACLPLIQRLGAHFTGMVNTHQPQHMAALVTGQAAGVRGIGCRGRVGGSPLRLDGARGKGTQGVVSTGE